MQQQLMQQPNNLKSDEQFVRIVNPKRIGQGSAFCMGSQRYWQNDRKAHLEIYDKKTKILGISNNLNET